MALDNFKNGAWTTVTAAPSPATSGTSLDVADATLLPTPPFNAWAAVVGPAATTATEEIVRVTNIVSNTLTIARAQEGTTAKAIAIGWQIAASPTAKTFNTDLATVARTDTTNSYTLKQTFKTIEADSSAISEVTVTGSVVNGNSFVGGVLTIDITTANVFYVTLNANITSFVVNGIPAAGKSLPFEVYFTSDGVQRTIVWPTNTAWDSGTAPTPTAVNAKTTGVQLQPLKGGNPIYGALIYQSI